ncbi:hypothetical protein GCM10009846_30970 [Agrococcus versicolor]|uniref:Glycosyltransferase subfamily 4-like N-terminal domain-containing protein n=1 Tax=Agrococcus versicolor TaxID=501482 RepID=A0ABP5MPP9_9MICO
MRSTPPIRVAAIPGAHPYVRAITQADGTVVTLPDPIVDPAHPERWWPPAMLDAAWIRANADRFDVMHVHFGMESLPTGRLEGAVDALDELRIPLVFTVHDLENPQLTDQQEHRRDLDVLVPRATRLLTLTPSAARRIRDTWGREATVIPHPTLLDDAPPPALGMRGAFTIGVHLRDLRPNIDGVATIASLLEALGGLRAGGVPAAGRVLLNATTRDAEAEAAIERMLAGRVDCTLVRRARPDDDALLDEIDALDVAWLPYAHGTHSGWVELCFDRGVPVVGPSHLPMAEQHPGDYHGLDAATPSAVVARRAIEAATRVGSAERVALVATRLHHRRDERKATQEQHASQYRAVMSEYQR